MATIGPFVVEPDTDSYGWITLDSATRETAVFRELMAAPSSALQSPCVTRRPNNRVLMPLTNAARTF